MNQACILYIPRPIIHVYIYTPVRAVRVVNQRIMPAFSRSTSERSFNGERIFRRGIVCLITTRVRVRARKGGSGYRRKKPLIETTTVVVSQRAARLR